ncbi:MAG: hypothetical protein J6U86_02895 [Clostridia bacterium]|nr:hypothetical protein [Clostridia bacterium]
MKTTKIQSMDKKPLNLKIFILIFSFSLYLLMEAALTPAYIYICSDITLSSGIVPYLMEALMRIIEIFAFSVCYSAVIFSAINIGAKSTSAICGIYISACLFRRTLSLGISYLSYGFIDNSDIFNISLYLAFEIFQLLIVTLICFVIIKRKSSIYANEKEQDLPCSSALFSCKSKDCTRFSCMRISALLVGIMLALVNIFIRIFYDISYGAPDSISEVLVMIAYYLSDVLCGIILYVLTLLNLSKIANSYKNSREQSL